MPSVPRGPHHCRGGARAGSGVGPRLGPPRLRNL